jgi:hypothetical protein
MRLLIPFTCFGFVQMFLLSTSFAQQNQTQENVVLTFRGIQFGTAPEAMQEEFAHTKCFDSAWVDGRAIVECVAEVPNYLGYPGVFSAKYMRAKLFMVDFHWNATSERPIVIAKKIANRISLTLGRPIDELPADTSAPYSGLIAIWKLSPTSSIQISTCEGMMGIIPCPRPKVLAILTDSEFFRVGKPDF